MFFDLGFQYYIGGRYAVAAGLAPVAGNLLHHAIERLTCRPTMASMRGEYDVAIFQAMKAVEVYVREAGCFASNDLGVDLMRKAFHEDKGSLTDKSVEKSERQARSALFAGAIGSYKNPQSRREVNLNDSGRSDGDCCACKSSPQNSRWTSGSCKENSLVCSHDAR